MQVPDHSADYEQLLIILLSENRGMRLDHVQQYVDHGGNAAKKAGALLPAQNRTQFRHLDPGHALRTLGVHQSFRGHEHHVALVVFKGLEVGVQRPGVGVEVLVFPELERIDEYGGDDAVARLPGPFHQGQVPLVKITHGRHEDDPLAGLTTRGQQTPKRTHLADGVHQSKVCSGPGNVPPITAST